METLVTTGQVHVVGEVTTSAREAFAGITNTVRERILEIAPEHLHQRVPVFLGSKSEVEAATRYHRDHDAG